jgi:hypothetical protein
MMQESGVLQIYFVSQLSLLTPCTITMHIKFINEGTTTKVA